MNRPLPVILAALLIDDYFRSSILAARTSRANLRAALVGYGFFLNTEELDCAELMVADFVETDVEMMTARAVIRARCPDWPCSKFYVSGD